MRISTCSCKSEKLPESGGAPCPSIHWATDHVLRYEAKLPLIRPQHMFIPSLYLLPVLGDDVDSHKDVEGVVHSSPYVLVVVVRLLLLPAPIFSLRREFLHELVGYFVVRGCPFLFHLATNLAAKRDKERHGCMESFHHLSRHITSHLLCLLPWHNRDILL